MDKSILVDIFKVIIVLLPFLIRELYTMQVSSRFELQFATNKIKLIHNIIFYSMIFGIFVILLLINFSTVPNSIIKK